jgi:hypothetical protein
MAAPTDQLAVPRQRKFEFPAPGPNTVGRMADVSADDCIHHLTEDSAPRLLWYGEDLLDVKLPAGTRVIYPKPAIAGLPDRAGAIRHAIGHPLGMDPLAAQLKPGMKVTIAIDDISLPLPPMRRPDPRETMLSVVLEMLAAHGISDIHIIVATSFHRRMTPLEMKHAVGPRIFHAYYPNQFYNHDGEDPDGMVELGQTSLGERVRINRRAAESDLLIYLNINLVPMDGGAKSVSVGLCDYASLQAHHTPQTIRVCDSYFDHRRSALTDSCNRMMEVVSKHIKTFHVETVMNNTMFDPKMPFFTKNEDRWNALDQVMFKTTQFALSKLGRPAKRKLLFSFPAFYGMIAVHAGATHPVHDQTVEYCYAQYCVPVENQADVVIFGVPFVSPYNVHSILNPLLVRVLGLGYFFNMYRGMPLVKKNGVMILTHPLYDDWDPEHHPSYIEFFHRILAETRDSHLMQSKYEGEFAQNAEYRRMYRTGNAYHGVHPFYMWYWGENGQHHVGKVIVVGAEDRRIAEMMGWEVAANMHEALDMAKSHTGRTPSITHLKIPPIQMVDVFGTPEAV